MTEMAERPRQMSSYGAEEVTRGLVALAYANGNTRKASRDLAEDGLEIEHGTLYYWKTKNHAQEYERLRNEILPKVREQAGDDHLALARRQMEASAMATEEWIERRHELDARDLSTAARNFDVGSGIHSQHAQVFHDQPTARVAIDLPGTLKELKSLGVDPEVVLDAEVVSEEEVEESSGESGLGSDLGSRGLADPPVSNA